MDTIVYQIEDRIYVNLTNKCSNNCSFCIRNHSDGIENYYLWLEKEPDAGEVIDALGDVTRFSQVVFCGFGEPVYKIDELVRIGEYVKSKGVKVRLNTNGQCYLIVGDDVVDRLKNAVDIVSISLNSSSAEKYQELCHSKFENAFDSILKFAADCKNAGMEVVMSVMESIGMYELNECLKIADSIGARLKVRSYI